MSKQGPRPHLWASGPDADAHARWCTWRQARNQAQWRGEEWSITFVQYCALWHSSWHLRGRRKQDHCMTRLDPDGAWSVANVCIMARQLHMRRAGQRRQGVST